MRGLIRSIATSYLALGVTLWILPGVQASGPASVGLLAFAVLAFGAVLRLILLSLSVILGALAPLVAGILVQAITGGAMPTVSRWLRSGDYKLREWHTGLPATTPAGQGVLLHGDTQRIPSFRWYEKDRGKIMVANRPADAAEIEARMSDGRGLPDDMSEQLLWLGPRFK